MDADRRDLERAVRASPNDPRAARAYLRASDRVSGLAEAERNQLLMVIHADRIPENLQDILPQYERNRNRLQRFGIVTIPENPRELPFITGIDGKPYPVPTFEQVITQLSSEDKRVIETINPPKLLLSPFARSNQELCQQLTSQTGSLPQQNPLNSSWDQNADRTGDLLYHVKQFKGKIGGMTKEQILALTADKNPFPGWNVLVVDGKPEIDQTTIVKEGGWYKNAHEFLKEYQDKGWDGLTPEDLLTLDMLAMETGTPFDQQTWCWLLGSYLKSARAVPLAGWSGVNAQVRLREDDPESAWYYPGSRGARRLGLGR